MSPPDRRALILYATQTSTASDLASHLSDLLTRQHLQPTVHSFATLPTPSLLQSYPLILLLVSTTGQGVLPTSATPLWRQLCRKKLPPTWLAGVRFGVFALGDSTYPKFCWAGRMVGRRLLQLGAEEVLGRVEADAGSEEGTEGAFGRWADAVRSWVRAEMPLPEGVEEVPEDVMLPAKWGVEVGEAAEEEEGQTEGRAEGEGEVMATLTENKRVTPEDHWQDTRLLTFALPSPRHWDPGDTVSLQPQNHPSDVALLLSLQGWDPIADRPLTFTPHPPSLPARPTLRTLLTHHLALTAIPTRRFFALAAHLTADENHAERLAEFADPQYIEELYDYTSRPRRTTVEVLQEFHTIRIPLPYLFELIPPLRARQFSIASAPAGDGTGDGTRLQLLVAIVKYKTVIKTPRHGVLSRHLSTLPPGARVGLTFARGGLAADVPATTPVLMIAPGTGVAPMRALIQARTSAAAGTAAEEVGSNTLIFGCRNEGADYYFKDEWARTEGLRVWTAFSRDRAEGKGGKRYVQSVVRERGGEVWRIVNGGGDGEEGKEGEKGMIFICGSSGRMPQAVREALIEVFEKYGRMDRAGAEGYLKALEKGGRLRQETW